MGREKLLMAYQYMVTHICLATGVKELLGIDQFIEPKNNMNLGLIKNAYNPLTRQAKKGATLLAQEMQRRGQRS